MKQKANTNIVYFANNKVKEFVASLKATAVN